MKPRTRSILQELNEYAEVRNKEAVFESRATNIINSAIHFIESLHSHYDEETALELERRLINSIKGADSSKFVRSIRKVGSSKNKPIED